MFWGMNLKPNRKYTQTTSKNFHISQAALDCEGISEDATNKIYINSEENQKFLVCTLRKGACEQTMLDLNFAEGDTICFQSIGSGNVSLTGYLTPNNYLFDDDDDDDEEEEEEDEKAGEVDGNDAAAQNGKALKNKKKQNKAKAAEDSDEDEDEDDDDDDDAGNELLKAALESDDEDEDEDDEDDDDDDEEEDDDEEDDDDEEEDDEIVGPKSKIAKIDKKEGKKEQQQKQQQQNGLQKAQKSKKENKAEKQQQQQKQKQQPQQQQQKNASGGSERTLAGGVKVQDIRVGNGPEVKSGKRAQVYYEGRLQSNNKTFDSLKNGAPFKFNVGRGDVIKAWDVGVVGMKVGGKRRIICPPHMAYGARGSPPAIPPNSTLVFEVELKGVN